MGGLQAWVKPKSCDLRDVAKALGPAITCQTCIHRLDVTLWGYWLPFGSGALQGLPNTFNSI